MRFFPVLASGMLFLVCAGYAQDPQEDVLILKDSTIIRGTITQTVTPGSPVNILRHSGKVTSIFWSEILTMRKLPVSMSDSAITVLYLGTTGRAVAPPSGAGAIPGGYSSPFGPEGRDTTMEDILVLNNGKIVRGWIVESHQGGSVGLWTGEQKLVVIPRGDIKRSLHLEKGMNDSTVDVFYIHPLPEMVADDYRIFTLFGGFSVVGGEFGTPSADGANAAGGGYGFGLHASLRVFPTIRWATTGIYGTNTLSLPDVATNWSATGSPSSYRLIWVLTGVEFRTEGTSSLKAFGFLQGGLLSSKFDAFGFTIPQTSHHPAGTGSQEGSSSSGFATCVGGGLSMGRFSISGRWLSSSAAYQHNMTLAMGSFPPATYFYKYDQHVTLIIVSLGFSPL